MRGIDCGTWCWRKGAQKVYRETKWGQYEIGKGGNMIAKDNLIIFFFF